jgi:nucleoside-diphosphate-sugar epimerase
MHVADVALAFKTLIESDVTGAINIGSGQPLAVGDLVNLIATKLEAKQLVQFAADEAPREHLDIVYADVGKLAELGFKPHIDLHAGIAETIKWWQLNGAAS